VQLVKEGAKASEIATRLGMKLNTVHTHLTKARKAGELPALSALVPPKPIKSTPSIEGAARSGDDATLLLLEGRREILHAQLQACDRAITAYRGDA
jgi:transposase